VSDVQLTLPTLYRRARSEFADRHIVSIHNGQRHVYTYEEFFRRVDRLAQVLSGLGVRRGDKVGTMAWNHHRHLELYVAVTSVGAVLHTINLRMAPEQALDVARRGEDVALFVDADVLSGLVDAGLADAGLADGVPLVVLREEGDTVDTPGALDYEALLASSSDEPYAYPELRESDPAAMAFSSATTGRPKGVVYTHRGLYLHSMMLGLADTWALSEADAVLPVVPMFHVNAWGLPFAALWFGSTILLPGRRPSPDTVASLLGDATFAAAVPTVWMDVFALAREQALQFPQLRLVVSGGAALSTSLLAEADELGVPLIHSYGMTEASPVVLVNKARSTDDTDMHARVRQGYLVPGLEARIELPDGGPAPRDGATAGELLLRGPWIVDGYLDDPRTAEAFHDGWYHTGDMVTSDEQGAVKVVDRKADLIKSGGEWISSVDLESALMDHPAVAMAAVIGVPDPRWQERPKAFVVTTRDVASTELRGWLEARFPRFWVPDVIEQVPELPLTTVGKFDKRALRQNE
jgi:fatty-acyl-CoA synthase